MILPKKTPDFSCNNCGFISNNKKDFNRHLLTAKHINIQNGYKNDIKTINNDFKCECGKIYLYYSGIWRHKKICKFIDTQIDKMYELSSIVIDVVKQNQTILVENKEFKELLIEQNKQMIAMSGKTCVNNTTNKFNLNFFLNEQCKDALNITDFVNSLQMQLKDLENFGTLGYVQNISKIFIRGLKSLDICKRPIHCSDLKREVLYIKDQNSWEKDKEQSNMTMVIKKIAHKNIKQIPAWESANPSYMDIDDKKNDQYMKMVDEVMGGATTEDDINNYNKIIKNVIKEVVVDKN